MILAFFALAHKIGIIQSHPCLFIPSLPFQFHDWQKCLSVFLQNYTICFTTVVTLFVNPRFPDTGLFDKISISYSSNPTLLLYFWLLPAISQISTGVINPIEGLTTHSWESALSWCSYESHHVTTTTVWDSPSHVSEGWGGSVVLL